MAARILFTGGGTAGHVTPNVNLIEHYLARDWLVCYVGSGNPVEWRIIEPLGIRYLSVCTGKLRRYFSWQNFTDPIRLLLGCLQSLVILLRWRPCLVFSKGGFVAVPVVVAAWLLRIPVVTHESDVTPGLATRLVAPLVSRICVSFPETRRYLPGRSVAVTGTPVRDLIRQGDAVRGRQFLGLDQTGLPVLLVFGGSSGSSALNQAVIESLPRLVTRFAVVHICGRGKVLQADLRSGTYLPFEYVDAAFGDVLAAASLAVSRAGANSLYELLFRCLPHLLIPLPGTASRGDQLVNARIFVEKGFSACLDESELDGDSLVEEILQVDRDRQSYIDAMSSAAGIDGTANVIEVINQVLESGKKQKR